MRRLNQQRQKSLFWKPVALAKHKPRFPASSQKVRSGIAHEAAGKQVETPAMRQSRQYGVAHALVDEAQNERLRQYEMEIKARFDNIEGVIKTILDVKSGSKRKTRAYTWASEHVFEKLHVPLSEKAWSQALKMQPQKGFQYLYARVLFEQFMRMSEDFYVNDPLGGQRTEAAKRIFRQAGFHAVGVAPCSDGRLAHFVSYVIRMPYDAVRRKAHAGAMFDISESVRNWVFVEHSRFREGRPNSADEPTRYLKIAVYHFSKADPSHLGCAAHGSDDHKAATAALNKLKDFRQAIANRFGCGSSVQMLLIGLNTDDDSLRVHVPDEMGNVCLERFVETKQLYEKTKGMTPEQATSAIDEAIVQVNLKAQVTPPQSGMVKVLNWLIKNNFSQIAYVERFEQGCYRDLGHEERFIGIGNGFDEVQIRNLSYYSYLDTIEEGADDVDVGIKIFKTLNVKKGLPVPIIVRCDFDGRVPGSKQRAIAKAERLETALHERYKELSQSGLLQTMSTLRDYSSCLPAERLN